MDLSELTPLIEAQGKAFEEFKKANDARLKAIEEKGYAPADLTEKVDKLNASLTDLSKQMVEIDKKAGRPPAEGGDAPTEEQKAQRAAFAKFLRKGDRSMTDAEVKAMNTAEDSEGGYLVVPEIDRQIDRIAPTISAMARLANVITISTAKYEKRVQKSGMSMRRVGEGATGGETTEPTFANIAIEVFPAEVEPWVNNETLEDAMIDLESNLAMEAGIAFAEGAGSEFITGNGVGKARGITAYTNIANASWAWGKIGYIASGKSAAFASVAPADKVVDLQHALKQQYRPNARWLVSDTVLGTMRQLKDGSGSYYLWQPDPAAAFGGRFLGSPVEIDDNMPALGAASYSLAYGDFRRGYTIVNRTGTTLIRDNLTSKGVTKFNFRRRFGGGVTHFEAIKLMKFATS